MDGKQLRQQQKLNTDMKAINRVLEFGGMVLHPDTIADLIKLKEMVKRRQEQAAAAVGSG